MNGNATQGPSGAPLPAWRQTPLDRKRFPDDPVKVGPTTRPPSTENSLSSSSTWKHTALAKKLLKYTSPAAATTGADQDRNPGSRAIEDDGKGVEANLGVQRPDARVMESTGSLAVDDPDDDRLLPIKENPILMSDREKRSVAKSNHAKAERRSKKGGHSLAPSSKVPRSEAAAAERSGSADHGALSASAKQKPHADDNVEDEVFDKEVTYGKGFVHKLLQKFINLSGKEDTASKTQGHSRSSGDSCGGGKTSSSSQHSNCDGENRTSGSLGHSSVGESPVQNDNVAGISVGKVQNDTGSKVDREQSTDQSPIDAEEFTQNIVSSTRDIFENSSLTTRKKQPSGMEKLRPEVAAAQTASKKRPAPGVPSTVKPAPLPVAEIPQNNKNLNQAGTTGVYKEITPIVNTKSEPQQNFQISQSLYSGSGSKKSLPQENHRLHKTQTTAGEPERGNEGKDKNTRGVRSEEPPGQTDKTDSSSHRLAEVTKQSVWNDMSSALGKVSSVVGSWGSRHPSGSYDAKTDNDDRDRPIETTTSVKVKQMKGVFAEKMKLNQNVESNSHTSFGSSVGKETENDQSKTLSGNFGPVGAGHNASSPQDSSRSTGNQSSAGVFKVGSGVKLPDSQREIERNVESDKTTTARIKVGYSATRPPKNPSSGDVKLVHSMPTKSGIHVENQVTVIQIGDGVSTSTYQNKTENDHRYIKRPMEERKGVAGNLHNHIIDERKSAKIAIGCDENKSNFAENPGRNASSELDVSENNIRNVVGNRSIKIDSLWEDPFAKSQSGASARNSDPKSPGAPRPGKLLIRPASNHPASKTNPEFLTMTKYNDIKDGKFSPARRPVTIDDDDDDEWVGGDPLDRERSPIGDLPDSEQFVFVGGGVSIGRSMLAKTKSGEKLRINFDDLAVQTFEYPSEQSLLADEPREPDFPYSPEDDVENASSMPSAGLLSSPALSAGSLSSYTPRNQVDYTMGRDRSDDAYPSGVDPEPESLSQANGLKPDSSDSTAYSRDTSADLLF